MAQKEQIFVKIEKAAESAENHARLVDARSELKAKENTIHELQKIVQTVKVSWYESIQALVSHRKRTGTIQIYLFPKLQRYFQPTKTKKLNCKLAINLK